MKAKILLLIGSLSCVGCTIYPKTYTYNPVVSINGAKGGDTQISLPSPFAKRPQPQTSYVRAPQPVERHYYPSQTTNINLSPYIAAHYAQPTPQNVYYNNSPSEIPYDFAAENTANRSLRRQTEEDLGAYTIP
jgi:hypothetical protein